MRALAAVFFAVVLVGSSACSRAEAHSWYEPVCCSGQDCRQVPARDVRENLDGSWTYLPYDVTFLPYMIRESQDERIHACIAEYPGEEGGSPRRVPRCLYLPQPRGF